jgi:hypothetical protein
MGYTHYWESKTPIPPDVRASICLDARTLIKAFPPLIFDLNIDDEVIFFDAEREAFLFQRAGSWECCKTRGWQYDQLVCAILAAAAQRYQGLVVGSDAMPNGDESLCDAATAWASEILRRHVPTPWKSPAETDAG